MHFLAGRLLLVEATEAGRRFVFWGLEAMTCRLSGSWPKLQAHGARPLVYYYTTLYVDGLAAKADGDGDSSGTNLGTPG